MKKDKKVKYVAKIHLKNKGYYIKKGSVFYEATNNIFEATFYTRKSDANHAISHFLFDNRLACLDLTGSEVLTLEIATTIKKKENV